mgnify:CR=1 FL=1
MMENEIKKAMEETGAKDPVIWLERGLHNSPDRLRTALQEKLDALPADETAILAFSQCGNAAIDLVCSCAKMVIPNFADCVRLTLCDKPGNSNMADIHTLYSSKGWMDSDRSMRSEYMRCLEKFGPEKTDGVYREILKEYHNFCLMDTGAYKIEDYAGKAKETAELFHLNYKTCPGYIRVYKKLFSGEWDKEFIVKTHGESLTLDDFYTRGAAPLL